MANRRTPVARPKYPIQSVELSLDLLLLFRDRQLVRVGEAAEVLGVAASTAHRVLTTLESRGFVRQDVATKGYAAGTALLELGVAVMRGNGLREVARPQMEELAVSVGETVHLIVLDGVEAIFIDSVESTQALRTGARIGLVLPAHCASGGKVLLAELSADVLHALYPNARLEQLTGSSLRSRAQLEAELDRVRSRGYALNLGESELDVHAVAVPIRGLSGHAHAALAVSGPATRLTKRRLTQIASEIQDASSLVGSRLA